MAAINLPVHGLALTWPQCWHKNNTVTWRTNKSESRVLFKRVTHTGKCGNSTVFSPDNVLADVRAAAFRGTAVFVLQYRGRWLLTYRHCGIWHWRHRDCKLTTQCAVILTAPVCVCLLHQTSLSAWVFLSFCESVCISVYFTIAVSLTVPVCLPMCMSVCLL